MKRKFQGSDFLMNIDLTTGCNIDNIRLTSEFISGHWRSSDNKICHFLPKRVRLRFW